MVFSHISSAICSKVMRWLVTTRATKPLALVFGLTAFAFLIRNVLMSKKLDVSILPIGCVRLLDWMCPIIFRLWTVVIIDYPCLSLGGGCVGEGDGECAFGVGIWVEVERVQV